MIKVYHIVIKKIKPFDVHPGLKPQDSRLPQGKRAQFSSSTHSELKATVRKTMTCFG